MILEDFEIGNVFECGGNKWICTNIGTEIITAIRFEDFKEMYGSDIIKIPRPIENEELIFDWFDMEGCKQV